MLSTVFAIYLVAGFTYWLFRLIKQAPAILKWLLLVLALPVLLPIALIKSLPEYLKKEGKWYKWRWVVYLNFVLWFILIVLTILPV